MCLPSIPPRAVIGIRSSTTYKPIAQHWSHLTRRCTRPHPSSRCIQCRMARALWPSHLICRRYYSTAQFIQVRHNGTEQREQLGPCLSESAEDIISSPNGVRALNNRFRTERRGDPGPCLYPIYTPPDTALTVDEHTLNRASRCRRAQLTKKMVHASSSATYIPHIQWRGHLGPCLPDEHTRSHRRRYGKVRGMSRYGPRPTTARHGKHRGNTCGRYRGNTCGKHHGNNRSKFRGKSRG